ncbi:GerAB/ArcD/ProY family transporter [Paenibacillus camelliae]|uniref:GerAB/ArcD/ProY family transporter n=1 Tax=Paenibacillus camelliae TaxID=512410 RepID=UPI00203EC155|nr:GerAB/ArcD/ProY family transporter [Paenibacillus camelliae]MCM3632485.1 GerAB/ArcD/ProY family transporter [Paenibacillus camelliae]
MSRYFYYLVVVEFVGSILSVIPSFLFESSKKGTIMSMLLALLAGVAFIYWITKFFNHYPGRGLPELLQQHIPKWIAFPILFLFSLAWFIFGLKTLLNYSFLLKRFLLPHLQINWIIALLLLFITYSFFMKTKKLLYTLEIVLFINIPLMIYIIGILYVNTGLDWDYVKKSMMYVYHAPNLLAFSASFLIFIGASNLIIVNREFKNKQKLTTFQILLLCVLGAWILFTNYFIPIGYNGFERIQYINFPWILGTDSLKVALAFLERIMFVFLFLHISVTFVNIIIFWHVSLELLKSTAKLVRRKQKESNMITYIFVLVVWSISLIISMKITESSYLMYARSLFVAFPPFFLLVLIVCWFISWRDKHDNRSLKTN